MKRIYLLLLWSGILFASGASAQVIISNTITENNINSVDPYSNGQVVDPNVYVNGIELAVPSLTPGIANDTYMASGWNTTAAIDIDNYYFEFSISAAPDYALHFSSFNYSAQKSFNGPVSFALRSSVDNFAADIGTFTVDNLSHSINLNTGTYQNLESIIFRVYGWNAPDAAGTFSINDFAFNGTVASILSITTGTVNPGTYTLANCSATANGTVSFSAVGSFSGNTYTAELSDNTGGFAAPVVVGTLVSDATSGNINFTIPAGTLSGSYKIRVVSSNPGLTGTPSASFTINGNTCSSLATDYFRSRTGLGDWNIAGTWESSHTGGAPWITSTQVPGLSASRITVQAGHTVTITSNLSINKTFVSGTLQFLTSTANPVTLTLANGGATDELTINNGGTLQVVSTGVAYTTAVVYGTSGNINVLTGGKISIGDGAMGHTGTGFNAFGTAANSIVYWRDGSIFEYNTLTGQAPPGTMNCFPNATALEVPILRLTKLANPTAIGTAAAFTVNGVLEVNTDITFNGIGAKIFRDGLKGNDTLTLGTATNINTPAVSGTISIVLSTVNLTWNNNLTIPTGSSVNISGIGSRIITMSAGSNIVVNGTIDLHTIQVSNNTGNVTINGTLKTGNANGLYGASAAFINGTLNLNNSTSTVEYNAAGPQAVQGSAIPAYYNVIISGTGTKTLAGNNNVSGTITIAGPGAGSLVFNAGINTFGLPATRLVMSGNAWFKTGGTGTKPDAGGTYTLAAGTIIEFAGTSATVIRLGTPAISYANVIVSGTDVSTASAGTGIRFQSGGNFTVQTGARFRLANTGGLSGSATTAVSNTNLPNVTIADGCTVEYNGAAQTITMVDYSNLELSGSGVKTAPSGILMVKGDFTVSGTSTFAHNGGTVIFNAPTVQTLTASSGTVTFFDLTIPNPNIFNVNSNIRISRNFSLNYLGSHGKLALNAGNITLGSNASYTASVDSILVDNSITYPGAGRFTVERYIATGTTNPADHGKSWQMLAVPTIGAQSVNAAWQEGNAPLMNAIAGYGTTICGDKLGAVSRGYDFYTPSGATLKTYNPSTDSWIGVDDGVTNTNALALQNKKGYLLLVRGDRSVVTSNGAATPTVLRTTGKLYAPGTDAPLATTVAGGKFESIGNPYASAIDFKTVALTGFVQDIFYIWDPRLSGSYGLGAYQTFTRNGSTYTVTPGGGSYVGSNRFIESGQAFLVHALNTGGTVSVSEQSKVNGSNLALKPPVLNYGLQQFRANLYTAAAGEPTLIDGVLSQYSLEYSSAIDAADALKMINTNENIGIARDNTVMSVESRTDILSTDTIFYHLAQLRQRPYQLRFMPQALDAAGLTAFVADNFTGTKTPISLTDESVYDFTVTTNAASYAADRLYVVFSRAVTPMVFKSISAQRQSAKIVVNWKVANENNVQAYSVERSEDGVHFSNIVVLPPGANNGSDRNYDRYDDYPLQVVTYYRIKAAMHTGEDLYSSIIKVEALPVTMPASITVAPNPVTGQVLNIHFTNQPSGRYELQLSNNLGQVIYRNSLQITNSDLTRSFPLGGIAPGIYQLSFMLPDNKRYVQQVVVR
jgi:hypothetical protein